MPLHRDTSWQSGSKLHALQTLPRRHWPLEQREAFGVRPACWRFRVRPSRRERLLGDFCRAIAVLRHFAYATGNACLIAAALAGPNTSTPVASRILRGGDEPQHVRVDITGWRDLFLIVSDEGEYDHDVANWAEAKLVRADGSAVFLDTLAPVSAEQAWGKFKRDNRSTVGGPMQIAQRKFERGLGTHAESTIHYRLTNDFAAFEAFVGIDASRKKGEGKVRFIVSPTRVAAPPPVVEVKAEQIEALRLAIQDLMATFGAKYPRGAEFLRRLETLEKEWRAADDTNSPPGLAVRQSSAAFSPDAPLSKRQRTAALQDANVEVIAAQFTALQREALLANPLLDFDRVLLLKRETRANARRAAGTSLGAGASNWSTADAIPRTGEFKDALVVLSNLRGEARFETAFTPPHGNTVMDPVLHFDADRILFAMNGEREKNYRLWEVRLDGSGLRQLTPDHGADVGHFDACYLPDDRIVFASTASYQGLPCVFGSDAMTCLYLLDLRTQQIRQLTFEQDSDWCPTVLPNGRVLYLRWEYTDQSHANSRILFHMNPDGTDQREFRGSGSWFPGSFFYAKPIPGEAHQIIGVASGHHGTARSGRLLIMDPSRGRHDKEGIVQEIPGRGKSVEPIVRDRLVDGVWPQFLMPAPLSAKYHLVAAKLAPNSLWGLYLVDVFDNITLIKEAEGSALLWPVPLQKRARPPVIPDRVKPGTGECSVFVADVHAGPGLDGVPRGTVKELRVIEYYFAKRGMGGLYGTLGADGPWDIKRILGTVPVEADGSAHFTMPANTPVCVQPLDARGQALQLERSWFVGMPGERVSCVGCHESQDAAALGKSTLAMRRPPSALKEWFGPARGFSFVREVQPVLDRHCVSCHDGSDRAAAPTLKGGETLTNWTSQLSGRWDGGGKFTTAYWELQRFVRRPGIEGDRRMFTPMNYHFSATELGQLLRKGHHGVELDAESHERLVAWHDLNAPFYGTWGEVPEATNGYGAKHCVKLTTAHTRAMELRKLYVPAGPFPDYEKVPERGTPLPRVATEAPTRHRSAALQSLEATGANRGAASDSSLVRNWPFDRATAIAMQGRSASSLKARHPAPGKSARSDSQERRDTVLPLPEGEGRGEGDRDAVQPSAAIGVARRIDLGSDVMLELVLVPGGKFLLGSTNGHPDEFPPSVVEVKPFWMARFETSNRQFKQFDSTHESRTEDRHGYQFGAVGYDQDQPDQPAVRVSWEEAMGFCRWLSTRTGLQFTLPTEAEWEWACRAGSAAPFSFGELDADFSPYANLGDQRLREFAADTSLDNYSAQRPMKNPNRFDDWLPRDDRFNDGGFITERVGKYQPNAWGLHDLHGNAAEWTRSAYRPYPYRDDDGRNDVNAPRDTERVVRGGSWRDRPLRATASYRLPYRQHQRVFNVGFRVVCTGEAAPAQTASAR